MSKITDLFTKYKEVISYLFFGVLTTLVNIVVSYVANAIFAATDVNYDVSVFISNLLANLIAMTFAYVTNRLFVFNSKNKGKAMLVEIVEFFGARFLTMVFDLLFMQATCVWSGWGEAPWAVIQIFGREQQWFYLLMKIVSNVVVIILNYIASKLLIFRKKKGE